MAPDRTLLLLITLAAAAPAAAKGDIDAPAIDHTEPGTGRLGHEIVLRATITDESGVFDPVVLYRVGTDGNFLRLPMEPVEGEADVYEAVVPADVVSDDLQYFIEAFDNNGNGPARYGDDSLPIKVAVLKTAEPLPDAPQPDGDDTPKTAPEPVPEEEGGAGLWIGLGVGAGVVVVLGLAAAATVGALVLLQPAPGPSEVDVIISAPNPTSGGGT